MKRISSLQYDLGVLDPAYVPERLLFRERQLQSVIDALRARRSIVVVGEPGMGKTTLVRKALTLTRVPHVYVDCGMSRTYYSILRKVRRAEGVVVLDDYTLARHTARLEKLVLRLPWKVLVVHPIFKPKLQRLYRRGLDATLIEMPPYSASEILRILEDRVVAGNLPVTETALAYLAMKAHNPRKALTTLRQALKHFPSEEIQPKHIKYIINQI